MRPDTTSANESEAAEYAAAQGRDEWVGGGFESADLTPYCSVCQRSTNDWVCGPCARDAS